MCFFYSPPAHDPFYRAVQLNYLKYVFGTVARGSRRIYRSFPKIYRIIKNNNTEHISMFPSFGRLNKIGFPLYVLYDELFKYYARRDGYLAPNDRVGKTPGRQTGGRQAGRDGERLKSFRKIPLQCDMFVFLFCIFFCTLVQELRVENGRGVWGFRRAEKNFAHLIAPPPSVPISKTFGMFRRRGDGGKPNQCRRRCYTKKTKKRRKKKTEIDTIKKIYVRVFN